MHTLRARLTVLYVAVTGGMFLVLGVAVYGLVGVMLMRQVDQTLRETASVVLEAVEPQEGGRIQVALSPELPLPPGTVVQVWDRENQLVMTWPEDRRYGVQMALQQGWGTAPFFRTEHVHQQLWRVLQVPILLGNRRLGTLQVAMPLNTVQHAQHIVLTVLLGVTLLAILVTAVVGYFSVRLALEPLAHVTALADQITHADDLSRRLPVPSGAGDEVWTLVQAFNATLGRLESLFQAQRRFIADIGHELRTPLTVIKGNAQWMRRIGKLDQDALNSIEEETDRMNRLIDDLLLLARAEAGKLPLRRDAVMLDAVLADVLREMQVVAREKGVHLEAVIPRPVQVQGDPDRLKQVFLNLVGNAVKYTPPGGEVQVVLEADDDQAICRVQDTGPGIPPEDLPHVFERFYRSDKARSRGKGFGLGLSIAYWIVKHHRGRIEVDSRLGEGTTFTVYLPRQAFQPELA